MDTGILAILFIIMRLGLTDAAIGYDCEAKHLNMMTILLENEDSETKEMLKRSMEYGSSHPDEFAFQFMGELGYMARIEEDKFYIVQCMPVEVKLEQQVKCYNRLPILRGYQRMFLTPRTHIITKTASELPCDASLLQDYELESTLYKKPRPVEKVPAIRLKRGDLFNSGIYSQSDIENWQNKQYNPPPREPVDYINGPHVIYLQKNEPNRPWYETWNKYSIMAVVALVCIYIIVCLLASSIIIISVRQRRRRMESNQHALTVKI